MRLRQYKEERRGRKEQRKKEIFFLDTTGACVPTSAHSFRCVPATCAHMRMFHTAGAPTTSHYGAQPYVRVHPPKRRRCTRQGKGLFRVGVAASRFENRSARNACTGARMRSPATQQRAAVPWREHLPDLMTACPGGRTGPAPGRHRPPSPITCVRAPSSTGRSRNRRCRTPASSKHLYIVCSAGWQIRWSD